MKPPMASRLRVYHFGATLVAIGIALWAMVWVLEIRKTTEHNLHETHCNQGLLTLATLDIWNEQNLRYCSPAILTELRGKYQ